MTQEELKTNFSKNLIRLRKTNNLTQLALAEKLNYSDKAVSKWEVGSVIPDVETMTKIAEFFGITVNDLIYPEKTKFRKIFWENHVNITILSIAFTWFLSTIIFFILQQATTLEREWLIFITAIPVSFILLIVFSSLWFNKIITMTAISGLFWSSLLTIFLIFNRAGFWFLFIIGITGQLVIVFWAKIKKIIKPIKISNKRKKEK